MVATGALQRAPRVRVIVCALRMGSVCAALQLMRSYKLSLLNGQAHASAAPVTLFSGQDCCGFVDSCLNSRRSLEGLASPGTTTGTANVLAQSPHPHRWQLLPFSLLRAVTACRVPHCISTLCARRDPGCCASMHSYRAYLRVSVNQRWFGSCRGQQVGTEPAATVTSNTGRLSWKGSMLSTSVTLLDRQLLLRPCMTHSILIHHSTTTPRRQAAAQRHACIMLFLLLLAHMGGHHHSVCG